MWNDLAEILELIKSSDVDERTDAAERLEEMAEDDPGILTSVVPVLARCLVDPWWAVRMHAAVALGHMSCEDPVAIQRLKSIVSSHEECGPCVAAAAWALWRAEESEFLLDNINCLLITYDGYDLYPPDGADEEEPIILLLGDEVIPVLRGLLHSPQAEQALELLLRVEKADAALEDCMKIMDHPDPRIRDEAMSHVFAWGTYDQFNELPEAARAKISQILYSGDCPNDKAILTLLQAGGKKGAETVVEYLSGREDLDELLTVRLAYAQLISRPSDAGPINVLQNVLSSTQDSSVRFWTVIYLCESLPAHPEIRGTLLLLLQDDDETIRSAVAKALKECKR